MLRITPAGADPAETLKLEGKLIGPWVAALREICDGGRQVRLDLSGVSYADVAGVQLLRELVARGAALTACPGLLAELLREGDRR